MVVERREAYDERVADEGTSDPRLPAAWSEVRSARSLWAVALIGVLPFLLVATLPAPLLGVLIREDGTVEWLGALAWLGAAAFFARTAATRRVPGVLGTLWPAVLALMSFVAMGEEISWGQRLIGYDTPEIIARSNLQEEMNLHNLAVLDVRLEVDGEQKTGLARWLTFNRISSLIWMGFLVALPLAVHLLPMVRRLAGTLRLPVPPLSVALAGAVSYAAFSVLTASLVEGEANYKLSRVSANEVKESVVAGLFLWTAIALHRRRGTLPPGAGSASGVRTGAHGPPDGTPRRR